jgi:hypothetical protein
MSMRMGGDRESEIAVLQERRQPRAFAIMAWKARG